MRAVCWNMRRAKAESAAWRHLQECAPDVALLQEVGAVPESILEHYAHRAERPVGRTGRPQRFLTVLLAKGEIVRPIALRASSPRVQALLDRFRACIVAYEVKLGDGRRLVAVSVYSPAWSVNHESLDAQDVSRVKLTKADSIWVIDLLRDALCHLESIQDHDCIIAGDFNTCELLDKGPNGRGGNREYLDRMMALGLTECLRTHQRALTPTFRHPRGSVRNQIDHMFASTQLATRLVECGVGSRDRVFGVSPMLSDHLPLIADFR